MGKTKATDAEQVEGSETPKPEEVSPAPSETPGGPEAPATTPSGSRGPSRARTKGLPAAPTALATMNTIAVTSAGAASVGTPALGIAVATAEVVGLAALGLSQRRRVKRNNRRKQERERLRRNGQGSSPTSLRSGRWTPSGGSSGGSGGSGRRNNGSNNRGGGGTGPTRSRSVNPGSGSTKTRSGSGGPGTGSGRHRRNNGSGSGGSGRNGSGGTSPRTRRLNRQQNGSGSGRTRTPLLFSKPGRPSAMRQAIGPRPAGQRRGGLIRNGNGQRRRPVQAIRNGARRVANAGRAVGRAGRAVGRGTRRVWQSRPARAVRRWTVGAARRGWGILGPAVGAVLAGANAALRRRGWRAVWTAMSTTWGRLRARWGPKNGKHAKAAAAATPPAPVVPATTVTRPAHLTGATPSATGGPTGLTGGNSMAMARIIEQSREMVGAAMMYNPDEGMMQIGNDVAAIEEVIRNVASAIQAMTRQVQEGETPMHPAIVDKIKAIHADLIRTSQEAKDLKPAFENLHQVDINRIRNPRPGEERWDLAKNRDYVGR